MANPARSKIGWSARNRLPLIVGGVALAVFLPSVFGGFVYDDLPLIPHNQYAQSLRYLGRTFTTHLWDTYPPVETEQTSKYYRPLVAVANTVNWALAGGKPWAFHLFNIVCHALTAVLATRIALRWTGHARLGVVAALIFALHPSRAESVSWISGRTDLLMALFMLAAVECAFLASRAARMRGVVLGSLALISTVLAIISKENAVATGLLIAVDAASAERRSRRTLAGLAAVTGTLGTLYVIVRTLFYPIFPKTIPLRVTLDHGLMSSAAYLERALFPWPQTVFQRTLIADPGERGVPMAWMVLGALVVAGYLGLVAIAWQRSRPAFWMLLAALVVIGPLLNFTEPALGVTTSDRFLYLPLFLFVCAVFCLGRSRLATLFESRAALLAGAGVLAIWIAIIELRTLDYADETAFWEHEFVVDPSNPVVLKQLSSLASRYGDIETAYALRKRSISAESQRYRLLSTPKDRAASYLRVLSLHAALSADGSVATLNGVFGELDAFMRREPGKMTGRVPDLDVSVGISRSALSFLESAAGNALAAETAIVAARIGADARARALLAQIPEAQIPLLDNPLNLILTQARLGDFEAARRNLAAVSGRSPGASPVDQQSLEDLRTRIGRAERSVRQAEASSPEQATVLRATAMGELGAYLRGLRLLRPLYDAKPDAPGVAPLYVQLLAAARLEREAREQAKLRLGEVQGQRVVAEFEAQLPERVRNLRPPQEPSPWWPPPR